LEDIASFGGGKTPSMSIKGYWQQGKHLWVTSKDMKSDRISDSQMKISDEALSIMTQYDVGTILIVTRSGILRHSLPLAILDKKATVNQDLKTISLYLQEVCQYIFYAIKANEDFILKKYHKDGTTVDSINFEEFTSIYLPIPPLAEQKRIVADIERWFALIDEIEQNKTDLQDYISQTKSKILSLAIHGKLVPQDPNDEPAIELLHRINLSFKPCDTSHYENLPFEIPQNWVWVRGIDIFDAMQSTKPQGEFFEYIDIDAIDNKRNLIVAPKHIECSNAPSRATRLVAKGDVLFSMVRPYLRNIALVDKDDYIASTGFFVCKPNLAITSDYCFYLMTSDYVVNGLNQYMNGDNSPSINNQHILNWLYPIPPLLEQKRIVAALKKVFSQLDTITAEL